MLCISGRRIGLCMVAFGNSVQQGDVSYYDCDASHDASILLVKALIRLLTFDEGRRPPKRFRRATLAFRKLPSRSPSIANRLICPARNDPAHPDQGRAAAKSP